MSPAVAALAFVLAQARTVNPNVLPARPHIVAARTAQPPVIDGRLDDPAWATAPPSDAFVQHFPDEGAPPTERTTMRVLYDDKNLYLGFDCEQLNAPIVKRLARRDSPIPSDGVWIDIDSRRTGVGAFHFGVNAAGMLSDGIHFDDTNFTGDWDAVWEAKVAYTDRGYSIEFRIPLAVLRFSAAPEQDWGFQARRFIDARQETDDWAFFPRSAATYVPLFGRLDGLRDLAPGHSFELRPFVLGRAGYRAADADTTLTHGWSAAASAGLDAKAHVTNELTLDLALNPDFGQVEADTVVLNLSTYETFFPEKRPFFLEGIDVFATPRPLVYTRRIGRQPAAPTLMTGEQLVAQPEPSPLYGAAKLVGTIGTRTTVGLLSALTGPNDVDVKQADGTFAPRRLDPWTVFNIARIKRKLAANAEVGILATAANRLETPQPVGATGCPADATAAPGPDGRCTNDAYVFSTDGRWRSGLGTYAVAWQALASTIQNGPQRDEPDGKPIRPGTFAPGASLYVGKDGGAHWLWNAWQHLAGRTLEFNDLGYLERKNDYQAYLSLSYRTLDPWRATRETSTALQVNLRETLDGLNLWREIRLAGSANLTSFWSLYFNVHGRGAYFDDRETGDGTALERAASAGVSTEISSDPRLPFTVWLSSSFDVKRGDGVNFGVNAQLSLRALSRLELALLPTGGYENGSPRYVSKTDTTYTFGTQTAASVGATLRAAFTFTPELSLQWYTQLFLARVHYDPLFTVMQAAGGRVHLTDLKPYMPSPGMQPSMPDTESATLNVNVVLRWEYRLGSTLFVVYTRAQNPALVPSANGASFEVRPLLQGRAADNVLMLKLAYWFG
ncbi:MAG TPA: DUF5916 domain-containing protein [Polyangia bacterium]